MAKSSFKGVILPESSIFAGTFSGEKIIGCGMTLNQSRFPLINPCFLSKQPRPPIIGCYARFYLLAYTLLLFVLGLWPFNFDEGNNALISSEGGLNIATHGTAYTPSATVKLQGLHKFTVLVDFETSSDGLDSLKSVFGWLLSKNDKKFSIVQWKDGIELHIRNEGKAAGLNFGADGVLEKDKRISCLFVYDGQLMYLYANGEPVRRENRGPLSFSNWSREWPLVVGTDADGKSQWQGRIYEVAIYDRALTEDEIAEWSAIPGGGLRAEGGESLRRVEGQNRKKVSGTRSQESGVAQEEDLRPLIHYVFMPENTYETVFRGQRAVGVRELGKGEPADLIIPEYFEPYKRACFEWDPDWIKYKSNWIDVAVNILGFIPFGILMMLVLTGRGMNVLLAGVVTVLVGFMISFCIEYLQAFLPSRHSSMRDLLCNTIGTAIGAIAMFLLHKRHQVTGSR